MIDAFDKIVKYTSFNVGLQATIYKKIIQHCIRIIAFGAVHARNVFYIKDKNSVLKRQRCNDFDNCTHTANCVNM